MNVNTYLFGNIEVSEQQIITFPEGLTGFESCKRFHLIHEAASGEMPASFTLQSVDEPAIAFQIIDPSVLGFTYELALSTEESDSLEIGQNGTEMDVAVMLLLYRKGEKHEPISAVVRAPLVINTQSMRGLQKILPQVRPNVLISNISSAH